MSTTETIPAGGELDRERVERIFRYIRGQLDSASRALDADDRPRARALLQEAAGLLNIDIRLIEGQSLPLTKPGGLGWGVWRAASRCL